MISYYVIVNLSDPIIFNLGFLISIHIRYMGEKSEFKYILVQYLTIFLMLYIQVCEWIQADVWNWQF